MNEEFIEIKYGNTIYNDGTISKTTYYHFDTVAAFRLSWENRSQLSKVDYQANVETLTIQCREFVDATEYLNSWGEEE